MKKYKNLDEDDDIDNLSYNGSDGGAVELEEIDLNNDNDSDDNHNRSNNNNNNSTITKNKNNKQYVKLDEDSPTILAANKKTKTTTTTTTQGYNDDDNDNNEDDELIYSLPENVKNSLKYSLSSTSKPVGWGGQPSLEENANIFSKFTYLWSDKFVYFCFKNILQIDQIPELASYDNSGYLFKTMDKNWKAELLNKKPSFYRAAFKSFGKYFMTSWIFFGLNAITSFIGPTILQKIVSFVIQYRKDPTSIDPNMGFYYAIILFCVLMFGSICLYQSNMISARTGNRLKSIIILNVYKKSLKLSNQSKGKRSNGEIINLMSNDAQRLLEMFQMINQLVFAIPTIIVTMVLLYLCIGWPSLVATLIMGLSLPFNSAQGSKLSGFRRALVGFTDQRIKVTNEIFQAIKTIKLYGWEESFIAKVMQRRIAELNVLISFLRFRYTLVIVVQSLPTIVSIVMFSLYYFVNKELPADKIFQSVALLNILRVPFNFLPYAYNIYIQFIVSIDRVVAFLNMDESISNDKDDESIKEININTNETQIKQQSKVGIYINNATFSWSSLEDQEKEKERVEIKIENEKLISSSTTTNGGGAFSLKNLNIEITEPGSLFMVIGPVGSGKTSCCQSILGEMKIINQGSLRVVGSIAYVSQSAWIMNATLRENILFGLKYDKEKYDKVISACALLPDIAQFDAGDQTEIGERGINLSGGQKQRVAIARAVYSDSDIYIMDDILSAVDAHVGKHLFYNCIKGILKDKIIVLTTNQLSWVPHSTKTLILSSNGDVEQCDTFENILQINKNNQHQNHSSISSNSNSNGGSSFTMLLNQFSSLNDSENNSEDENEIDETISRSKPIKENEISKTVQSTTKDDGKLTTVEEREEGTVSFSHYLYYFTAGGKYLFLVALTGYFVDTAAATLTNWWLSHWSSSSYVVGDSSSGSGSTSSIGSDGSIIENSNSGINSIYLLSGPQFLGIFIAIGISSIILLAGRTVAFYEYTLRASRAIHIRLFMSMIRAPMWYFDTNPLGRILNRFTRDTDIVDLLLQNSLQLFLNFSTNVLAILVVVSIVTPMLLLPLFPICVLFYFLQHFYRKTSTQLQRLESVSRSPIFSHFSETLNGVITLRAFRKCSENIGKNWKLLDDNNKCYLTLQAMNQWLGLRLSVLGNFVTFFSCLFITLNRSHIAIASVGLSVSYTLSLTNYLNKAVQQLAETETKFISVERIVHYTKNVPQEPVQIIESNRPPSGWPNIDGSNSNDGSIIKFNNVVMSYREGLPPVLKDITFSIKPKEKIGIVGRTGSGKSSCLLALFRLIEITSGSIVIDGIDISKIGLLDLRSQLAIIPQDPVLFTGTIRDNLDPLQEHLNDDDLWQVLKDIQMYDKIIQQPDGLNFKISENGTNLSQGEGQLICLGRALLKKPKILVCDEATASVDAHSDSLIQATIRSKFKDCTILTIAHRLDTILDSDRILVLDQGMISEFDKPSELLKNENSLLNWLISETGTKNSEFLKTLIKN